MAIDGDGIDHSLFGTGYQPDAQRLNKYVLSDDAVRYDAASGAGGAVPVRNYDGVWPPWRDQARKQKMASSSGTGTSKNAGDSQQAASSVTAMTSNGQGRPDWMCKTLEQCSACAEKEMHLPFCQPYGNKVTIECREVNVVASSSTTRPKEQLDPAKAPANLAHANDKGEISGQLEEIDRRRIFTARSNVEESDAGEWVLWKGERDEKGRPLLYVDRGALLDEETSQWHAPRSLLEPRQDTYVSSYAFKGYQICGRSRAKEAGDYAEFVGVNLLLSLVALYFLLLRQRDLAKQHQSMIARRVGRA